MYVVIMIRVLFTYYALMKRHLSRETPSAKTGNQQLIRLLQLFTTGAAMTVLTTSGSRNTASGPKIKY